VRKNCKGERGIGSGESLNWIERAIKPQVLYQPQRLPLFLYRRFLARPPGETIARVPWGRMAVDTRDNLGYAVWLHGVYEMAVSEALARLVEPGDTCVDTGANVGAMTMLMAARAGRSGRVFAFEPHPVTFGKLLANLELIAVGSAPVNASQSALLAASGTCRLVEPDGFEEESGLARVGTGPQSFDVPCTTLDLLFPFDSISVLKVDVEGAELEVILGADGLLSSKKVRDIVFEDHNGGGSPTQERLKIHGYTIWRLHRSSGKPLMLDSKSVPVTPWEPATFLATRDDARAQRIMLPYGWRVLEASSFGV
jgi:FkbM family methyltransferase